MTWLLNIIILVIGISMLYVSYTSRLEAYIKTLSFQGFLLFLLIAFNFGRIPILNFAFLVVETLIIKTIIIPVFLLRVVRKNGIYREVEPYIANYYSVLISTIIMFFGFFITFWLTNYIQSVKTLYLGISITIILNSLFLILSRKKIFSHILGYIFLENGIFLLSLSIAEEMPFIVNMGVLLDIFVAIFLFGIFLGKIKSTFKELNVDSLSKLKD